jgi:glycosyltransferase involved in cell wall biosynthesis
LESLGWRVSIYTSAKCKGAEVHGNMPWGKAMSQPLKQLVLLHHVTHLLWQYVPYGFSKFGLPWYLPSVINAVSACGVKHFVFFHEVALRRLGYGFKQYCIASVQLRIAHAIERKSNGSFTSIPLYASYFRARRPTIIPVGSNLFFDNLKNHKQSTSPVTIFAFTNRVHRSLLEGFALLQSSIGRLVICGAATQKQMDALQGMICDLNLKDSVEIRGVLSSQELAELIQKAAFAVHPQPVARGSEGGVSAKNGTMAALMAAGKAVITNRGDMTDGSIFCTKENCLFVPYHDSAAWTEAMRGLISKPEYAVSMGHAAAETYNRQLDWRVTVPLLSSCLLGQADQQLILENGNK